MARSVMLMAGLTLTAVLGGCSAQMGPKSAANGGAMAELRDPAGAAHGTARIALAGGTMRVTLPCRPAITACTSIRRACAKVLLSRAPDRTGILTPRCMVVTTRWARIAAICPICRSAPTGRGPFPSTCRVMRPPCWMPMVHRSSSMPHPMTIRPTRAAIAAGASLAGFSPEARGLGVQSDPWLGAVNCLGSIGVLEIADAADRAQKLSIQPCFGINASSIAFPRRYADRSFSPSQ
jgi:hypothetical protein